MDIIDGFKGTLDFYLWNGIICVRTWPKKPLLPRSNAVKEGWPAFAYASKNWQTLSPQVQEAYKRMSAGTRMTGRDVFMKAYINGSLIVQI